MIEERVALELSSDIPFALVDTHPERFDNHCTTFRKDRDSCTASLVDDRDLVRVIDLHDEIVFVVQNPHDCFLLSRGETDYGCNQSLEAGEAW